MIGEVFNLDHKMAIASLDRIAGLDASVIYPGHGDPWNGSPAEAVSLARSS
jgi:glyoxylase-like metal-dependent hydrolase (beta-lactamase superfamily II)